MLFVVSKVPGWCCRSMRLSLARGKAQIALLPYLVQYHRIKRRIHSQQRQRSLQHTPLLVQIVRVSQGRTTRQLSKRRSWRCRTARHARIPTRKRCGDTVHLQHPCDQSNGLTTDRSSRNKKSGTDLLRVSYLQNCRRGLI